MELEGRLPGRRDEADHLAVVLVHLGQALKETRPRRLDVHGWLGADCELEGECERLVGHDVLAEEPAGLGGHPSYVLDPMAVAGAQLQPSRSPWQRLTAS
jgi:hypothetical protein